MPTTTETTTTTVGGTTTTVTTTVSDPEAATAPAEEEEAPKKKYGPVLTTGFTFGEGQRIHNGKFYCGADLPGAVLSPLLAFSVLNRSCVALCMGVQGA
jgi:hypothetical protein